MIRMGDGKKMLVSNCTCEKQEKKIMLTSHRTTVNCSFAHFLHEYLRCFFFELGVTRVTRAASVPLNPQGRAGKRRTRPYRYNCGCRFTTCQEARVNAVKEECPTSVWIAGSRIWV